MQIFFQAEVSGHSADSGISSSEKLEADKALTLTFSQHPAPLSPVKTTPQYEGPVIEDVYENFPRPLYDIAVIVAEDLAKNKGGNELCSPIPLKSPVYLFYWSSWTLSISV